MSIFPRPNGVTLRGQTCISFDKMFCCLQEIVEKCQDFEHKGEKGVSLVEDRGLALFQTFKKYRSVSGIYIFSSVLTIMLYIILDLVTATLCGKYKLTI